MEQQKKAKTVKKIEISKKTANDGTLCHRRPLHLFDKQYRSHQTPKPLNGTRQTLTLLNPIPRVSALPYYMNYEHALDAEPPLRFR